MSSPLLLPLVPEVLLIEGSPSSGGAVAGEEPLLIGRLPEWLATLLGKRAGELENKPAERLLEPSLPGIVELARSVLRYRRPVEDYRLNLTDARGETHAVSARAEAVNLPDQRRGVSIGLDVQESLAAHRTPEGLPERRDRSAVTFHGLVGASEAMRRVFNRIRLYGAVDAPVLVTGETGAGKEGVARAIHAVSRRSRGPLVAVNCSAISEGLFESELFGHEKGSFTGALRSHRGRFERADGGTLFLDEIGDLPANLQTKLLRVIEDETIERVGGETPVKVNVRLVAATNRDLEIDISRQTFRADLFYRIGALQIHIPPLRERPDDLPWLVDHFIEVLNRKYDRRVVCLSPEALHLLQQYKWPGNVRELRNLMERLFAENQTEVIGLRALREWYEERVKAGKSQGYDPRVTILPYRPPIELGMADGHPSRAGEKIVLDPERIRQAFRDAGGNMTQAAAILGVHKATLYRSLKQLKLDRHSLG